MGRAISELGRVSEIYAPELAELQAKMADCPCPTLEPIRPLSESSTLEENVCYSEKLLNQSCSMKRMIFSISSTVVSNHSMPGAFSLHFPLALRWL